MKKDETKLSVFVRGVLLILPIFVVGIVITKFYTLLSNLVMPLEKMFPSAAICGLHFSDMGVILLMISACYALGLLSKSKHLDALSKSIEDRIAMMLPGYSITKQKLIIASEHEGKNSGLMAVLVHFDDYSQIAFKIESVNQKSTLVYLPGSPDLWSGQSVVISNHRIQELKTSAHQVAKILRDMGRGSQNLL